MGAEVDRELGDLEDNSDNELQDKLLRTDNGSRDNV